MRAKPDDFSYHQMRETCDALAASGSKSSLAALRAALSDRKVYVRVAAACALASVHDSSGVTELRTQLTGCWVPVEDVVEALQLIGGATNNELANLLTSGIIGMVRRRSLTYTGLNDWLDSVLPLCMKTIALEGTERSPLFDKLYAEFRAQVLHMATDTNRQDEDFEGPLERCHRLMIRILPLCSPAKATIDNLQEILRWCAEKIDTTPLLEGANRKAVPDYFTRAAHGWQRGSGDLTLSKRAKGWPPGFV